MKRGPSPVRAFVLRHRHQKKTLRYAKLSAPAHIQNRRRLHLQSIGARTRNWSSEMTKMISFAAAFTLLSLGAAALLMQAAQMVS